MSIQPLARPTDEAYAELQQAFDHYNKTLFDSRIPHCLITFQREKKTYGYFSSKRFIHHADKSVVDEIAMNPAYFAVTPVLEVMQTLVHEMVHAWQFHFGAPGRRGYHNREWAEKMEAIGLMPSSTGQYGGAKTGEKMADYAIEGGLFMQATEALMAQGFHISWLDRYPAVQPGKPGNVVSLAGAVQNMPAVQIQNMAEPDFEPGVSSDEQALEQSGLVIPEVRNRSNRVKYRCPGCNAQVWGKPSLKLLCGEAECEGMAFEGVES